MERWAGRVALVTGASKGIGACVAKRLVAEGMKVVGAARSIDRLQTLANELKGQPGTLIPIKCDLTKDEEVLAMFAKIKKELGGVDVCINNAGLTHNKSLLEGSPEEWREIADVNMVALCLCTRESIASMRERDVDDGHVIHICSSSGHRVSPNEKVHFYAGTKFAVKALTEGLRQELRALDSNIRISSISPALTETEFALTGHFVETESESEEYFRGRPCMRAEDVTATLVHVLGAPPHVQIHNILMRATKQIL